MEKGAYFANRDYAAVPFSDKNFRKVKEKESAVVFVDGGNAEIIETATFALQFIRAAAVKFSGKKREWARRKDFYVKTKAVVEGGISYQAKVEALNGELVMELGLNAYDKSILSGGRRAAPSKIGMLARRVMELSLAKEIAEEEKKVVIALDGTLEAGFNGEEKHLQELYDAAEKNGNLVVALAKTNSVLNTEGGLFAELLDEKAPEGAWVYAPVVEISSEKHKAEMGFVKMHASSKHIFRFEIYKKKSKDLEKAANALTFTANDLTFPGYPYGFIIADRFARVSNQELEYLKAKNMAGKEMKTAINAKNAHEILDSM
ncbi:DNA double-strand break repair nuclease NurA [Candidatus Woesearchaeota archaeon]|nr:DNA double-strand break repair nuclease NurA [Candidatus Woesearchaeota archaeon]